MQEISRSEVASLHRGGLSRRCVLQLATGSLAAPVILKSRRSFAAGQPIPIGLSAALTGQFAQNGAWMKNGVSLATKEINAVGGINGHSVNILIEDDQGPNPTAAANAVTKLLTADKVVAIIGPHFTPGILPVEPMLARRKVPALTGASGPIVTQRKNPFIFRVRLDDATGANLLVKYVIETLGWKRIGLCYVNTAFGQSGIAEVRAALTARKIDPVATQTHLDSTKDFTSQILAFSNAKVDGVIAWTDDQPSGLIAKQMKTLGVHFQLAGSTTFSQPPFLQLAGDAANGIYAISDFVQNNPSPEIAAWKKKYAAVYGEEPELYATTYYDAMNLLADALRRAGKPDGEAIRAALAETTGFRGVMTTYSNSPNGDMVHSGLITRVENSKPAIIQTVSEQA